MGSEDGGTRHNGQDRFLDLEVGDKCFSMCTGVRRIFTFKVDIILNIILLATKPNLLYYRDFRKY